MKKPQISNAVKKLMRKTKKSLSYLKKNQYIKRGSDFKTLVLTDRGKSALHSKIKWK